MKITCAVCGDEFEVHKGNVKYCPTCRDEIYHNQWLYGTYIKSAKATIELHREEREKKLHLHNLRKCKTPLDIVVQNAIKHGRSYGHEVAVMEGRLYK